MVVNSATALLSGITLVSGQTFTVVIDPDTALEEIVDVIYPSSVSSTTLTISRTIDGSAAIAHSAGAAVRHMAIGRDFREANTHINGTLAQHAATTSLELKTLISDETGSGSLVFATSPTLVTPVLGVATATSINGTTIPSSATLVKTSDTGTVTTGMIADSAITTVKITDANVTTAKIADSAITSAKIADLGIATGDIADLAITSGKIATGAVGTVKIDDLSITEGKIASSAVTAAKIASDAVTTVKILDANVTTAKIADSAITSAKIADLTIATGDIADSAITSAKIADGTIVAGDIADGAITSAKILDGTIDNADISATAGITYGKLSLNSSITSADIVNGTIVAADIADGTITAAKLTADPFARANHTGTQLAATVSDFDTQVRTSRLDQMAAPTASVALNAQKITGLGTPTLSTDASTKGYVDTSVANLVNSAPGTLDTLGEIATAISAGGTVFDAMVLKAGSTMTGALVLSGAPTIDLHAATKLYVDGVAGSATAAAASAAAAATTYDNFDDRYLGAKTSAPTLDNDGNALITGAIYWNTPGATMYAWTGSTWGSISSSAEIYRYRFTATGGETSKSGADDSSQTLAYIAGKEQVYLNGVLLVRGQDYTATNGTSITALAALAASDVLEVITFTALSVVTDIPQSIVDAKGDLVVGTAADTVGRLAVGTNGYYLKADSTAGTGLAWSAVSQYALPTQTSNSGKYLTTNGTSESWATVDALPSQTSNSGKYLTTDGTTSSWATVTIPTADNDQPILASQIFG
jgi:hypothetical protein